MKNGDYVIIHDDLQARGRGYSSGVIYEVFGDVCHSTEYIRLKNRSTGVCGSMIVVEALRPASKGVMIEKLAELSKINDIKRARISAIQTDLENSDDALRIDADQIIDLIENEESVTPNDIISVVSTSLRNSEIVNRYNALWSDQ